MEDWQQWQIEADAVAATLNADVDALERDFFSDEAADSTFRGFWPRFRDLKERVRVAPAIKLDAKLDLERRLRGLGSRAYKAQEVAYARSGERKDELLARIADLRGRSEATENPRELRSLRRDLDGVREQFDSGSLMSGPDRQTVWDTWREASQFVWQRLTAGWQENEAHLRQILDEAQTRLDAGDNEGARQGVGRFFDALKTRESRQDAIGALKAQADRIRRTAEVEVERRQVERVASQQSQFVPAVDTWRAELARNHEALARLEEEVAQLDREFRESTSLLDQAMIRGTLVEKKRRLAEYQRTTRSLVQRIEQTEDSPLISAS